jgi:pyruvate ferredoxin oxidoreductase delta subunit
MSQIVRSFRPVVDMEKCNKCTLCQIYCPEGTVIVVNKEVVVFDYRFCKGCGICATECPTGAIGMEREA